jgi:hypothetical protein
MADDKKKKDESETDVQIKKPKVELKELEVEDADEVKGGLIARDTLMCGW